VAGGGSIWPRSQITSKYASGMANQARIALVHSHQLGCSPAGRRAIPEADEDRSWLLGLWVPARWIGVLTETSDRAYTANVGRV
jgi:hypothetical protein